jgi:hypothetical protein
LDARDSRFRAVVKERDKVYELIDERGIEVR